MFDIETIQNQIAQIIRDLECIKNGDCCNGGGLVDHPNEPWVNLDNTDLTFISYSGESGNILNGTTEDIDVSIKYNVISPNSVVFKSTINLPITIDTTAVGYSNGAFIFTFRFPAISSVVNGWFNGTTKTFVGSTFNPLVGLSISPPSGGSNQYYTGGAVVEFQNAVGENRVRVLGSPKTFDEDGNFTIIIGIDSIAEII